MPRDLHIYMDVEDGYCSIFFSIFKEGECQELELQSTLSPGTRSPECMQRIVEWISTCRETHKNCHASSLARPKVGLPTRLLDVSQSSDADKLRARLCYTKEIPSDAEYLSLSHTWGSEKFLTLNNDNHDDFLRYVPVMALPQSFQDAIYVTGALKHRYLWIDSLCIIQDDPNDWRKECMRMADVYKNAVLNLSASWVSSNKNGFLVNQRSNNPVPVLVNKDVVISEKWPWKNVWNGPLFTRAWVLQEQILAPRAVHFAEDQIHWECPHLYANEVMPLGVPTSSFEHEHEESSPPLQNNPAIRNPFYREFSAANSARKFWHFAINNGKSASSLDLYSVWMQIIEEFSSRRITVYSDRLPALDGLASEFAQGLEVARSTFIHGLWRNDLPRQLLWCQPIDSLDGKPSIPDWDSVPSWSWVSTKTPIYWLISLDHLNFSILCSILDRDVDGMAPNYALCIQGRPFKFIPQSPYKKAHDSFDGRRSQTLVTFKFFSSDCHLFMDTWYLQSKRDVSGDDSDLLHLSVISEMLVLPLTKDENVPGQPGNGIFGIFVLLLWRGEASKPGTYRRVGAGRMERYNELKVQQEDLGDDEVVERCEDGSVVVCVV